MRRLFKHLGLMAVAMAVLLAVAPALAGENTITLDYEPKENPVADRTVHITINKQDGKTFEFVEGAHLQILDAQTKEVVMDWTSDGGPYESARALDIDHAYILHEAEAPEGYEVADDVEFILRSVNFETKGEVVSGAQTAEGDTNAEFRNVSGDIEAQSFVISLYDAPLVIERTITEYEEREREREVVTHDEKTIETHDSGSDEDSNTVVITREETVPRNRVEVRTTKRTGSNEVVITTRDSTETSDSNVVSRTRTGGGSLTKTADETSFAPVALLALAGAGAIVAAKRRA